MLPGSGVPHGSLKASGDTLAYCAWHIVCTMFFPCCCKPGRLGAQGRYSVCYASQSGRWAAWCHQYHVKLIRPNLLSK